MLFLVLCLVLKVSFGADPPGGYYHAKYDYLDLDGVLNHKRLVYHYANCLLSREPCPPQGMELKEILPEALQTTCLRCTEKQKAVVSHVIRRLKTEYPDVWRELSDLWDPTGEHLRKFEAAFNTTDPTGNDVSNNVLVNRFGEDESANEVAGSLKPTTSSTTTTPIPTKPKLKPGIKKTTAGVYTDSTSSATPSTAVMNWWTNGFITTRPFWRPTRLVIRPQPPSWLGDVSSKVIQAGAQVAEMVLSTVQAALGG